MRPGKTKRTQAVKESAGPHPNPPPSNKRRFDRGESGPSPPLWHLFATGEG